MPRLSWSSRPARSRTPWYLSGGRGSLADQATPTGCDRCAAPAHLRQLVPLPAPVGGVAPRSRDRRPVAAGAGGGLADEHGAPHRDRAPHAPRAEPVARVARPPGAAQARDLHVSGHGLVRLARRRADGAGLVVAAACAGRPGPGALGARGDRDPWLHVPLLPGAGPPRDLQPGARAPPRGAGRRRVLAGLGRGAVRDVPVVRGPAGAGCRLLLHQRLVLAGRRLQLRHRVHPALRPRPGAHRARQPARGVILSCFEVASPTARGICLLFRGGLRGREWALWEPVRPAKPALPAPLPCATSPGYAWRKDHPRPARSP